MASVSQVGAVAIMPDGREYRVDAIDFKGRTIGASRRIVDPVAIAEIGEWDTVRNISVMQSIDMMLNRHLFACKVCQNEPDECGALEHGRGCYVVDEDGGGTTYIDMEDLVK